MAERLVFDAKQYQREVNAPDFDEAQQAYDAQDYEKAQALWKKAYANGNVLAGVKLGIFAYCHACDYGSAFRYFEETAKKGHPLGTNWLAECYAQGKGRRKDVGMATQLHELSMDAMEEMAATGDPEAEFAFGYSLLYGDYGIENMDRCFSFLHRAMLKGHPRTPRHLGAAYVLEIGTKAKHEELAECLRDAMEKLGTDDLAAFLKAEAYLENEDTDRVIELLQEVESRLEKANPTSRVTMFQYRILSAFYDVLSELFRETDEEAAELADGRAADCLERSQFH